jgi:hypothetical protein
LEFRRCLDHRALCEVWTALAPGGRERLVKFVHSFGRSNSRAEAEAVARLTALTHPGLERLEVASHRPGSLLLATDPPGQSLGDAFQDSRLNGLPGVPRWDLLRYLATAAEALDYLASHHGIQHLGLNPGNLFVGSDHCLVADAGLVQLLWLPAGHSPFQLNALYSAPELFDRRVAPGADQFSLALIYLEMLTGQHPQLGLSPRKLAKARRAGKIDLARLPAAEREVVARALHPDPGQRFRRCTEFVAALEALSAGERPLLRGLPPVISAMWPCLPAGFSGPVARPEDVITELIASAQGSVKRNDGSDWSFSLDGEEQLHCHFMVEGTPAELRSRLDAFCRQWNARVVCADPHYLLCQVGLPRGFLQRCIGRGYGLEIHVHLQPRATTAASLSEVQLQVKALRCSGAQAEALLEEVGPVLVNSLRGQMHPQAEQRGQERQVCRSIVRVHPVLHNFLLGQAIECKARDVSLGGVGFLAPRPMPTPQFYIELLKEPAAPLTAVLARVVRERPADDGCYDVGAAFCLDGCG